MKTVAALVAAAIPLCCVFPVISMRCQRPACGIVEEARKVHLGRKTHVFEADDEETDTTVNDNASARLLDLNGLTKFLRSLETSVIRNSSHDAALGANRINTSRAQQVCLHFQRPGNNRGSDEPSLPPSEREVTVLVSTFDRFDHLPLLLNYYASSPIVAQILVTWQNPRLEAPRTTIVGGVPVHFLQQSHDSLNNRFNPSSWINESSPVFVVDDDMKVHLQDLDLLHSVWKTFPEKLVGFAPRWFSKDKNGLLRYEYSSEDPKPSSPPGTRPQDGYAIMLTKAMIMSSDMLYEYTCGKTSLHRAVHDMVDIHFNCEDIGMSMIASVLHMRRLAIGMTVLASIEQTTRQRDRFAQSNAENFEAPVMYVEPRHLLGDFGKMDGAGLHQRVGHAQVRSLCLNIFAAEMFRLTNQSSVPLQRSMVSIEPLTKVESTLNFVPYELRGKPSRVHQDCVEIKGSQGSYFKRKLNNPCSWDIPTEVSHFTASWRRSEVRSEGRPSWLWEVLF